MSIDVMKQALEALENHTAIKHPQQLHHRDAAITALRAAIEQRKPVAWRKHYENSGYTYYDARWKNIPPDAEPLYL
jgi:hypothetical protein